MGLFSFIKEAGEKLFGRDDAKPGASPQAAPDNEQAAQAIRDHIAKLNLAPSDLAVKFDAGTGIATVSGTAADQAAKEKILLAAGNVQGVAQVDDQLAVAQTAQAQPEARLHTVARGETLSAISKTYYGDANKYRAIFEANRPMLSDPDKIYPGQVLRIPPQA